MSTWATYERTDADAATATSTASECQTLIEFVTEILSPIVTRRYGRSTRWCAEWWRHGEVVHRLESLWRAWETARLDGGPAMSEWWIRHVDGHFSVLFAEDGPLRGCTPDQHVDMTSPLPAAPLPPEGDVSC